MADHYWLGRTSVDHNVGANWAPTDNGTPGSTVPGTGDLTFWTGTGGSGGSGSDNPCDITTATWLNAGMNAAIGYTAQLDLLVADVTVDAAGDVILDNTLFDMGTGTLSVDGGTFDNKDVGTFTEGASVVRTSGTSTITGDQSNEFFSITNDGTLTISQTGTGIFVVRDGVITNSGTITISATTFRLNGTANWRNNVGASNVGGTVQVVNGITDSGVSLNDGTFSSDLEITKFSADSVFAPGDYGLVDIRPSNGTVVVNTDDGTYDIPQLMFSTPGSGLTATLNSGDNTNYSVGTATVDINGIGDVTINDGLSTVWNISEDFIDQITGGGDFDWPAVAGATINAVGTGDQFWDIPSISTISDVVVAQTGFGSLELQANLDCQSFTGVTGQLNLGGAGIQLTTTDGLDWQAGFVVTGLGFAAFVVGGKFMADGQNLESPDAWDLFVVGTAVASGQGSVSNSDADLGAEITAIGWEDGGNNRNWRFALNAPVGGRENVFGMQSRNQTFGATKRNTTFRAQSRNQTFTVPGTR